MNEEITKKEVKPTEDEKNWAIFCHLSALFGYIIVLGNVIGPLIVWLVKKDNSDYINEHGKAALNFQISILIYSIIAGILVCIIIGIPLLIAIFIINLVMIIKSAISAGKGEMANYPLSIRFIF